MSKVFPSEFLLNTLPYKVINEHEGDGGTRLGNVNRSTLKKPAPLQVCLPQIPHDLTWDRFLCFCCRYPMTNLLGYGKFFNCMYVIACGSGCIDPRFLNFGTSWR
jgi:hypothetical protein